VDKDGFTRPEDIRLAGRVVLLIQACIHPGESEGKDAGLMFIRDLVSPPPAPPQEGRGGSYHKQSVSGRLHPSSSIESSSIEPSSIEPSGIESSGIGYLLDHVSLLFIPIFNVDGHERFGPYNRINQNGPEEMGWRVTATNLNLNRDYLKADAPEMQAWLQLFNRWLPDFFIDIHTTDGADYQYVLTYMMEVLGNMDPGLTRWCSRDFLPSWTTYMDSSGFPVFPYIIFREWHDPRSGLISDVAPPMLSQGYVALRNRPGLLIETHMLKPYRQRVESSYECLLATMTILNREADSLKAHIARADQYVMSEKFRETPFTLQFDVSRNDSVMIDFKGVEYEEIHSEITGGKWFRYSSTPASFRIPWFCTAVPTFIVNLPDAYVIPVEWKTVIDRLKLHGIQMKIIRQDTVIRVTSYKFKDPRWQSTSYEGHHPMTHIDYDTFTEDRKFPAGSVIVETVQPAARVIAQLLEPDGDGSLVYWGFFDAVFEQKEYAEYYILEPLAKKMLAEDPELKKEFTIKLASDSAFAQDQRRILYWFFERTPYWDLRRFVYPVARINW